MSEHRHEQVTDLGRDRLSPRVEEEIWQW